MCAHAKRFLSIDLQSQKLLLSEKKQQKKDPTNLLKKESVPDEQQKVKHSAFPLNGAI